MNSKLFNTFIDTDLSLTHFEYSLIHDGNNVGEYQLTFEEGKVILSIFKINEDYRGKRLSILALKEIDKQLISFLSEFDFSVVELNAKSFNNSDLNHNQLISLYKKYFGMEVYHVDKEEILMKKTIH